MFPRNCLRPRPRRSALVVLLLIIALPLAGCGGSAETPSPDEQNEGEARLTAPPIKLLVVEDPGLAQAIQRAWQSRADGVLEIEQIAADDLLAPEITRLSADAVIYPVGMLGELVERQLIVPLPDEALRSKAFDRRDIFAQVRQRDIVWGETVYAVPLGSPPLLLLYRADVFERLSLDPPGTWQEYDELCQRLADPAA